MWRDRLDAHGSAAEEEGRVAVQQEMMNGWLEEGSVFLMELSWLCLLWCHH